MAKRHLTTDLKIPELGSIGKTEHILFIWYNSRSVAEGIYVRFIVIIRTQGEYSRYTESSE